MLMGIVLFLLEKIFDAGIKQNMNVKLAYVIAKPINTEILIHGPCEPLWMIDPDKISQQTGLSSYNLALSHSDFADNYLHLYLYLKHNKAPKLLFLYVTPESMDTLYNTFNTYRFVPWLNDSIVSEVVKECDPDFYRWHQWPFMRYAYYNHKHFFQVIQGYKHYLQQKTQPYHPNGFEPPAKISWDNHLEEFKELYPRGYYFQWSKRREKYLKKIIGLAKSSGIRMYLYESPVLKEAIPWQPNRNLMLLKLKQLAQQNGLDYWLFSNMKLAESRANYISVLNFNLKAALQFSDTLGATIRKQCE